jgi:hypothetical protein
MLFVSYCVVLIAYFLFDKVASHYLENENLIRSINFGFLLLLFVNILLRLRKAYKIVPVSKNIIVRDILLFSALSVWLYITITALIKWKIRFNFNNF